MRRRRAPVAVLVLALAALLVTAALGSGGRSAAAPRPAAALPRTALTGTTTSLADLRGHPAVLVFWASWCEPCRHEADAVARFASSATGHGHVVGVAWSDERWSARAFVEQHRWRFPVLFDAHGAVGDRYGIRGLPTTFVLDAHGRIVRTLQGPQTAADLDHALREARS